MKKLILLGLITLLILPMVMAGTTYYLEDFSKYSIQQVTLGAGDRIEFNLFNARHTIILDQINPSKSTIDLAVFPFLSDVMYISISPTKYLKMDLNKDNQADLLVKLKSQTEKDATLLFERVYPNDITGQVVKDQLKTNKNVGIIISAILALVVILIASIFILKRKIKWLI